MRVIILFMMLMTFHVQSTEIPEDCVKVTYLDRNSDGKVDREHHDSCLSHSSFELLDDNFDGKYEVEVFYGWGPTKKTIDLPVPNDVPIEKENFNKAQKKDADNDSAS